MLNSSLLSPLFNEPVTGSVFSDQHTVRQMLRVEAALARVQGRLGIIPAESAEVVANAAGTLEVDFGRLQRAVDKAGVPVSELVRQLRSHCGPPHGEYAHWGATTQDIMDTTLVLQLKEALRTSLLPSLRATSANLVALTRKHRYTLMVGRTHSQQALPITFGLKTAGWLAPLVRDRQRIAQIARRLYVVQFGGAAGTLAALGADGPEVRRELAHDLGLAEPLGVWHTQRDSLVELAGWLSLVSGSLAKMAQDIILMAQSEAGELRESADNTRGGSSTMPQKSNPMVSEAILAIHRTNVAHLSALHNALVQEHERGTHGWQVEWLNLPRMMVLTAAALAKASWLTENLVVDSQAMLENVAASKGLIMAEAISFALAAYMPRGEARRAVAEAAQQALNENRDLVDLVKESVTVSLDWEALQNEANYLGATDIFIDQVLEAAEGASLSADL